jgi:hypothetical protein
VRVLISHETQQRGLLFKTTYHVVQLDVHFTHEERQVIRQRKLEKTVLLERRPANAKVDDRDDKFTLLVGHLGKGPDRFLTANPGEAKAYQAQLLIALEQLKDWVTLNADEADRTVIEF